MDALGTIAEIQGVNMRTTQIHLTQEQLDSLCAVMSSSEVFSALGYLSTWSQSAYPIVDIYHDGKHELLACYRKQPWVQGSGEAPGYVICAVPDLSIQKFSFHS